MATRSSSTPPATPHPAAVVRITERARAMQAMRSTAIYTIYIGDGTTRNRAINAYANTNSWVSLGVFNFQPGSDFQGFSLSNWTPDGDASEDIAWDAMASQALPGKPKDIVVQMGDSYSSGEGVKPYLMGTDVGPLRRPENRHLARPLLERLPP